MQNLNRNHETGLLPGTEVVCFGVLSYLQLMIVDRVPVHNGGTQIEHLADSYGDDAGIVAGMLHQWGQKSRFIPSALGDDELGNKVAATVDRLGVPVRVTVKPGVATVTELSIVDPSGARTYFYQRTPELLATLDEADLTPLESAAYLYVDWYDGDHVLRPMKAASQLGVPVFVNIESQHGDRELVAKLAPYTTVCQVSADGPGSGDRPDSGDEPDAGDDMASIANVLLDAGIDTVVITGGSRGCLAADASQTVRVGTPQVNVVDGNGAGSCFSGGFIYGRMRGWTLEGCARFATAQASLKCGVPGYKVASVGEGERVAETLHAEIRARH